MKTSPGSLPMDVNGDYPGMQCCRQRAPSPYSFSLDSGAVVRVVLNFRMRERAYWGKGRAPLLAYHLSGLKPRGDVCVAGEALSAGEPWPEYRHSGNQHMGFSLFYVHCGAVLLLLQAICQLQLSLSYLSGYRFTSYELFKTIYRVTSPCAR